MSDPTEAIQDSLGLLITKCNALLDDAIGKLVGAGVPAESCTVYNMQDTDEKLGWRVLVAQDQPVFEVFVHKQSGEDLRLTIIGQPVSAESMTAQIIFLALAQEREAEKPLVIIPKRW